MQHIAYLHFFFQAEDGIRDATVTGVQTCALPISGSSAVTRSIFTCCCWLSRIKIIRAGACCPADTVRFTSPGVAHRRFGDDLTIVIEIGRASWRERVKVAVEWSEAEENRRHGRSR